MSARPLMHTAWLKSLPGLPRHLAAASRRLIAAWPDRRVHLEAWVLSLDRGLLRCLALSFLLHLAVMVLGGYAGYSAQGFASRYLARTPRPMELTLSAAADSAQIVAREKVLPEIVKPEPLQKHPQPVTDDAGQEAKRGETAVMVGPLTEMQYFRSRDLDARPIAKDLVNTDFERLGDYPQGGWVLLNLAINEGGTVDAISVEKTSFPPSVLAPLVEKYRQLSFIPAEKDGQKVKALMRVLIEYSDDRTRLRSQNLRQ